MKSAAFVLLALAASAFAETNPITRGEIIPTLRGILLDMHGGASALPRYAERLERERGFTRVQMENLLLEIAADESWDGFARDNAIVEFIEIAKPEELVRLDPFYASTNKSIRTKVLCSMQRHLETIPDKLAYVRTRLDWLAEHPEFQTDALWFAVHFSGYLEYYHPTEYDKRLFLDFFRNEATNGVFSYSFYATDMLLMRFDGVWPTNEARRAMMEKWKDDPGTPEDVRLFWNGILGKWTRPNVSNCVRETDVSFGETLVEGVAVGEPLQARTEPIPDETNPAIADETPDEALQEPTGSFSTWIGRVAALALAAALACLVIRRNRRR